MLTMNNFDFVQIFTTVYRLFIDMILPGLAAVIVHYIYTKSMETYHSFSAERQARLLNFVKVAIKSAEQLVNTNQLENVLATKKAYVLQVIQEYANLHGMKINVSVIEAEVEAAIYNGIKKVDVPVVTITNVESYK